MELFFSANHFIIEEGDATLCIDRRSGEYTSKLGENDVVQERTSLGTIYGYVGRLQLSPISEYLLVFIRQRSLVGDLQGHPIYRITSIVCIPLESGCEISFEPVLEVLFASGECRTSTSSSPNQQITLQYDGQTTKPVKVKIPACPTATPRKPNDKMERRLYDEFLKVMSDPDSFYYSNEYDITNSIQRQQAMLKANECGTSGALQGDELRQKQLWEQVDPRFWWNQYMVESLIETKDKGIQRWVLPVLQGYIELTSCPLDREDTSYTSDSTSEQAKDTLYLWIISRRSRYQAGTRYLRRGINDDGKVANYVETEQIVLFRSHILAFVQTRGSIPVYWSQGDGFRYRPPPKLERDEEENFVAFKKHFSEETSRYGPVYALSLVEKTGKEKVLGDAFLQYILRNNSSDVIYVTFDFHESCRGMRFENISVLVEKLSFSDAFRNMNYCWVDHFGTVLLQSSVFRVNCIDCLDRTNVVQMYLAKEMLTLQLCKIGLIAPEIGIPPRLKKVIQSVWANNGDTLSKQYAGTNALKGDFTRTGERRIAGVMKDGMNSANRYYLNRFRDASRQAAIDLMLGVRKTVTEEDLTGSMPVPKEEKPENTTEHLKLIIEDVKATVIPTDETVLGIWGLVNAKMNEPEALEIDIILILSVENIYVVEYDLTMESINGCQKTPLVDLESLGIGFERLNQPSAFWNGLFGGRNISHSLVLVPNVRLNYIQEDKLLQQHIFRSTNVRFFNNVPFFVQHPEEILEGMRTMAEAIKAAVKEQGKTISINEDDPALTKDASKASLPLMASTWVNKYFNANVNSSSSEGSLNRFRPKNLIRGFTSNNRAVSPSDTDMTFGNGVRNSTGETTIISVSTTKVKVQKVKKPKKPKKAGKLKKCVIM